MQMDLIYTCGAFVVGAIMLIFISDFLNKESGSDS